LKLLLAVFAAFVIVGSAAAADWPMFGYTPSRQNVGPAKTGITAANVAKLHHRAIQLDGTVLTTVEGLADGERLHPIQEAFREHHGLQCGFCTPGLLLTAKALLEENPAPTDREIREAIAGNLCRCTGYHFIVDAIRAAARGLQR